MTVEEKGRPRFHITCDICGKKADIEDDRGLPSGWTSMSFSMRESHVHDDGYADVCTDCSVTKKLSEVVNVIMKRKHPEAY